jgi:hypothetical protein
MKKEAGREIKAGSRESVAGQTKNGPGVLGERLGHPGPTGDDAYSSSPSSKTWPVLGSRMRRGA